MDPKITKKNFVIIRHVGLDLSVKKILIYLSQYKIKIIFKK